MVNKRYDIRDEAYTNNCSESYEAKLEEELLEKVGGMDKFVSGLIEKLDED